MCFKTKKIYPVYAWKQNPKPEKQFILLMTPNGQVWCYIAMKKLSSLLIGKSQNIRVTFLLEMSSFPLEQKTTWIT